jgi:F420-0:gamma-glutamyl ligase
VVARSDRHGDVGIRVAIKASKLTVLDLDLGEKETLTRRLSQTFLNIVESLASAADEAKRQVA